MKPIYRIARFTLIMALLLAAVPVRAAEEPQLSAVSVLLMDRDSGRVLWENNGRERLPMASVTKIMTAVIALEKGRLDDIVVVSERAAAVEGSSVWLEAGERKTLEELIFGLMLRSGNDAAAAIAEHLAGSVSDFCKLMNNKAREIGANDTNFVNPHGLPAAGHYSTAYDLALISAYALKNDLFRSIITTESYTMSWPGHPWDRVITNQNRLLDIYPGGDGVKTGWTREAGRCFVGSATRDGWQLVAVVLNAPQMWEDAMALLDYGFATYNREKLLYRGQVVRTASVRNGIMDKVGVVVGDDYYYPLLPGEENLFNYRFEMEDCYQAPLAAGELLGQLEIYLGDRLAGRVDLQAGHAVDRMPLSRRFLSLWLAFLAY